MRVDAGRDLLGELALGEVPDAAGELDHLETARDLAARVVEHLAVLGGDDAGELVEVLGDQLAETEHHPRALDDRRLAPLRERRSAAATARSTSAGVARVTSACGSPMAGSKTGAVRSESPRRLQAGDPVPNGAQAGDGHRGLLVSSWGASGARWRALKPT